MDALHEVTAVKIDYFFLVRCCRISPFLYTHLGTLSGWPVPEQQTPG